MPSQKYKSLFNDTLIFAIGNFGSKIISFFLVPIYTNVLSTSQYGTADLVMTCATLLVPVFSLVIQDSVLRFGLSGEHENGSVLKCASVVFIVGSIVSLLTLPLLNYYESVSEWKYYLIAITITTMASNIMFAYAKTKGKNKLFALCSIVQTLVLALTNILLLVVFNFGVSGFLTANIAAQFISVLLLFLFTGAAFDFTCSNIDKKLLRSMIAFSTPLIANNLSWWVLNSSDRMMVEYFIDSSSLGLYSAASKIPALLSIITSIFSQAWSISAIREYYHERDNKFYSNIFSVFATAMFFGGVIIVSIVKPFMSIYVGENFYSSWSLVPLLLFGTVYYAFSAFFGSIYGALKKNIRVASTTAFAAIINICINLVFLRTLGVVAAAMSTAISYFLIGIYRMFDSQCFFKFKIDYLKFFVNTCILVFQTIMVSLDKLIYIVSLFSLALLVIVNWAELKSMAVFAKTLINKSNNRDREGSA